MFILLMVNTLQHVHMHEPISEELSLKKKWLEKDIRQLSEFCHTGSLEVYHSLMLKYVPKRQEFDSDQMWTRTALAAMDHNLSQNRGHKLTSPYFYTHSLILFT